MPIGRVFEQVQSEFKNRKFAAGLAIAFIDFLEEIGAVEAGIRSYEELLARFPRVTEKQGKRSNTFIVKLPSGGTRSIRPAYGKVEALIRSTHQRLDYPSAARHATQAWGDYTHWLGEMACASRGELLDLRQQILDFVLDELPSHAIDPSSIAESTPMFSRIIGGFEFSKQRGELTGSAFQGLVFAYLRADAPHLQVEVRKVRTGSKRVGMVGDIDAWDGDRLIISAEAKHYAFGVDSISGLANFASEVVNRRALGLVVADSFAEGARKEIERLKLAAVSKEDLGKTVSLWDPLKQKIAAQAFLYYASHVEQNAPLARRVIDFLKENA